MKERNYWPHFIMALVLFAVVLGVWTVKVAIDNPVELDNSFMMRYQQVDERYYEIEQAQRRFDRAYRVELENAKLQKGKNVLRIRVSDLNGTAMENARVELLITRPDTSRYDRKLQAIYEGGLYRATVDLPLEGRWNIVTKVEIDKDTYRYATFKRSTRRVMEDKLK
ncbi:MAG: hypothetical protein GXO16_07905 [Epsilonproteobacteria bacterium]|nr:hypothetical protein [Campylobacterota bacterium]